MKFKVGDRVKIDWKKSAYCKTEDASDVGTISRATTTERGDWVVKGVYVGSKTASLGFFENELSLVPKTLDKLCEGDVVVDEDGDERTVLGVCGKVYLMSSDDESNEFSGGYTAAELENIGFKPKDSTPEVMELTIDEIADKFEKKPEEIKIKK